MASPLPAVWYENSPYSPIHKMRSLEDDEASQWSVQVNVSSPNPVSEPAEDVQENEEENPSQEQEEEEGEEEDNEEYDELCQGLSGISVRDEAKSEGLPAFAGRHTRFVYNSDGELEGEEESKDEASELTSPSVTRLKGLPTPKGKHLRFSDDEQDDENGGDGDDDHSSKICAN